MNGFFGITQVNDASIEQHGGFVKKESVRDNQSSRISREELRARIQQVIDATNIVELIDPLLDGGLQKKGGGYVGLCPFHSDSNPSFSVSEEKAVYRCWSCDAGQNGSSGGNAVTFVMRYFNKNFMEACQMLADRLNVKLLDNESKDRGLDRQSFFTNPDLIKALRERRAMQAKEREEKIYRSSAQEQVQALSKAHALFAATYKSDPVASDYIVNQRKISPATVERFNLGYAPPDYQLLKQVFEDYSPHNHALVESGLVKTSAKDPGRVYDTFRNRLLFPVRDDAGQTVGFGGRLIKEEVFQGADGKEIKAPKYLNSPESAVFQKSELLFGWYENQDQISAQKQVIVVEGYMDVVGLYDQGVGNAVACMGVALTEKHVEKISTKAQEIVVCFDGDNAGRLAAARSLNGLLPSLHLGVTPRFLLLKGGLDPDEFIKQYGKEAFEACVTNAHSLDSFIDIVLQDISEQNKEETNDAIRDKQSSQLRYWMRLAESSPHVVEGLKVRYERLNPAPAPAPAPAHPAAITPEPVSDPAAREVLRAPLIPKLSAEVSSSSFATGGFAPRSNTSTQTQMSSNRTQTQPVVSSGLQRNKGSSLRSKRGISPEERIVDTIALAPRSAYQQIRLLKEYAQKVPEGALRDSYDQWVEWYSQEARVALAQGVTGEDDDRAASFLVNLNRIFEISAQKGLLPEAESSQQITPSQRFNP